MEQKISQCRIILYRTDPNKYSPAIVNAVNEDGSVNLTIFEPGGGTRLVENVIEGPGIGQWEWPGVDSREKKLPEEEPNLYKSTTDVPRADVAKPTELSTSPEAPKLTSAYPIPGQK